MKSLALTSCLALALACTVNAQEVPRFNFDFAGGFTQPTGMAGTHLNEGWNMEGGPTLNFSSYLGAKLQLDYNSFGINSATLANVGFPGGDIHVFSATIDPVLRLFPHRRLDPYVIGGFGLYHRTQQFTQPSAATFTAFDPFFGGFFPVTVPTTEILSSYSVNKPGFNIGGGVEFGISGRWKGFAEARWNRILMGNNMYTEYVPVSFGLRF